MSSFSLAADLLGLSMKSLLYIYIRNTFGPNLYKFTRKFRTLSTKTTKDQIVDSAFFGYRNRLLILRPPVLKMLNFYSDEIFKIVRRNREEDISILAKQDIIIFGLLDFSGYEEKKEEVFIFSLSEVENRSHNLRFCLS